MRTKEEIETRLNGWQDHMKKYSKINTSDPNWFAVMGTRIDELEWVLEEGLRE